MFAIRAIEEEYLGLDVEGSDHRRYFDITPLILIVGVIFVVIRFVGLGTGDQTDPCRPQAAGSPRSIRFEGFQRGQKNPHSGGSAHMDPGLVEIRDSPPSMKTAWH